MSNITTTIVLGSTLYPSPLTLPDTDSVSPATPGADAVYGGSRYAGATLTTAAYIRGGAAGVSIAAGIGVDLTDANIVTNGIPGTAAGQIFGGVGSSDDSQFTGVSGSGGIGVSLSGGSTLNNTLGSTVTGGKGGYYGRGTGMLKGGTGGDGVYVKDENGGTINNYGRITGGLGGVYSQVGLNVHGPGYSGGTGGVGVDLSNSGSGTLINASSGKIFGGYGGGFDIPDSPNLQFLVSGNGGDGVQVYGGSVLENYGQITGGKGGDVGGTGGRGLYEDGGNVRNQGSIKGGSGGGMGVYLSSGFLSNAGTIAGGEGAGAGQYNGGEGVFIWKYGTFTSYGQYGSITGGESFEGQGGTGVEIYGNGQLLNDGFLKITGGAGAYGGTGLMLDAATPYSQASVTLTGSNTIEGGVGLYGPTGVGYPGQGFTGLTGTGGVGASVAQGATLTLSNSVITGGAGSDDSGFGAVGGKGGVGITITGGTVNSSQSTISGGVGGAGALGFAYGGGGIGVDLTSYGSSMINGGTITGGRAAYYSFGGTGAEIGQGTNLTNSGQIFGGNGSDLGPGGAQVNFAPAAGVVINGGTLIDSGVIGSGTQTFENQTFTGDAVQFEQVAGASNKMVLESGWQLQGDVSNFTAGDTIDVLNLAYATALSQLSSTQSAGGGFSTGATGESLVFAGSYSGANQLILTSINGGTGTEITVETTVACYLRGTRIRTADAEVAIERLRVGDQVLTRSGELRPIRWIGRRSYPATCAGDRRDVLPVLIRQGALGDDLPWHDLRVSPEHALWIDGVLIPARALINGRSIVQDTQVADISYFHLEFDDHDVIYAEGVPAESFVDDESRLQFDNVAEYWTRYPHERPKPAQFCAPRVEDGAELEAVRHRLAAIAGRLTQGGGRSAGHDRVRTAPPPAATA